MSAHEIEKNRGCTGGGKGAAKSGKKKSGRVKVRKLRCYLRYSASVAYKECVSSGFILCSSYFMRSDATKKGCAKMNFDTVPKEYFLKTAIG